MRRAPIKGLEGRYEIQEDGKVFNSKTNKELKTNTPSSRYNIANIRTNGKTKGYLVHRLVAESFIPNPDNLPQVNHIDCNKRNNCIANLEWVTAKENLAHAYLNNLMNPKFGEAHHNCKLSKVDVAAIRDMCNSVPQKDVAVLFGVSKAQVSRLVSGKRRTKEFNNEQ